MAGKILSINLHEGKRFAFPNQLPLPISETYGWEEAQFYLQSGNIALLVLFLPNSTQLLEKICVTFFERCGYLPDQVLIVCEDPQPNLQIQCMEFGMDKIVNPRHWLWAFKKSLTLYLDSIKDPNSYLSQLKELDYCISEGKQGLIMDWIQRNKDNCFYNHFYAINYALAYQSIFHWQKSEEICLKVLDMNPNFRPASNLLIRNYMQAGNIKAANDHIAKLDRTNLNFQWRKYFKLAIEIEENKLNEVQNQLEAWKHENPTYHLTMELELLLKLKSRQVDDLNERIRQLPIMSSYLAGKLNDFAIELVHSHNISEALEIYDLTHKIVLPTQRYKLSLNAAIASIKAKEWRKGQMLLDRSKKEYGGGLPVFTKIENSLTDLLK